MATNSPTPGPRGLFLPATVIGVEAFAALVFGVVAVTTMTAGALVAGVGVALLMLGYGAFLIAISRGLARGERWSRGAAVATQLLQALLAYSFLRGETVWVGLVLGILAVVTLVSLFTPTANAVFAGPAED